MNAGAKLALYGAGVAVAFGAAFGVAATVVPDTAVAAWVAGAESDGHGTDPIDKAAPIAAVKDTVEVEGFTVSVDGALTPGASNELAVTVTRGGEPVSSLEPQLGTFGSLVAHDASAAAVITAEGALTQSGDSAAPSILLTVQAPSSSHYVLYLDFQIDGRPHTAKFVFESASGAQGSGTQGDELSEAH